MKGVASFGEGKIEGVVRIVKDARYDGIELNEILVTPKTTPDMIPLMKKAKAIVTDHGGRTSHAMIVCRDNYIPCIIGTSFATRELKNGDIVELDLEKRVVNKIGSVVNEKGKRKITTT